MLQAFYGQMLRAFVITAAVLVATAANADDNTDGHESHGGDGVVFPPDSAIYLLDLVEQGVEDQPIFAYEGELRPDVLARVATVFTGLEAVPVELIVRKLHEIEAIDQALGIALLKTFELFSWRQVRSELVDVRDEDSVLSLPQAQLVQLAIRRMQSVLISRPRWLALTPAHRAALIFHEAVYALIRPELVYSDGASAPIAKQSSEKAREINGYLFSQALSARGVQALQHILRYVGRGPVGKYFVTDEFLPFGNGQRVRETQGSIVWNKWVSYNRSASNLIGSRALWNDAAEDTDVVGVDNLISQYCRRSPDRSGEVLYLIDGIKEIDFGAIDNGSWGLATYVAWSNEVNQNGYGARQRQVNAPPGTACPQAIKKAMSWDAL